MYMIFYVLAFVGAMAMLTLLLVLFKTKISPYYFMMFTVVTVSIFGCLQMATARTYEAAIFANQVTYLGGCFSPYFMLMCVADLCKVHVKGSHRAVLVTYAGLLFAAVCTIGRLPIYYDKVSFVVENGIGRLEKEYGLLHVFYPIYVVGVGLISIVMITYSFRRQKDVSYITCILLFICMGITDVVYVAEKIFDFKYEMLPFSFLVSLIGTLILLRRISLYDVNSISTNSMVASLSDGFFICDSRGRYLGSDEAAKIWFPEVKELAIDHKINTEETEFFNQVGKWIRGEEEKETAYIEKEGRIYEAKHSIIKECRHHTVHCIYLQDDTKQQMHNRHVERDNVELEKNVEAKREKLKKMRKDILISMASIVENRDSNTGGHIARTSDIVLIFVKYLEFEKQFPEFDEHFSKCIVNSAPLHDFGKIAIPDIVLNKPGRFTDEEYEMMKQHSEKGAVIVESILHHSDDAKLREIAVNVAHYHHEKWDGSGYPEGLKGEDIPLEARVMALADVFDALVSKRVYKEKYSYDKAFGIIEESCGTHFDPRLCKAFLECRPRLEELYNSYTD